MRALNPQESAQPIEATDAWVQLQELRCLFDTLLRSVESPWHNSKVRLSRRLNVDDFYRNYYSRNRPVSFRAETEIDSLSFLLPEQLRSTHGDVLIEVMAGRHQNPLYELQKHRHRTSMMLGEFVTAIQRKAPTNDLYLVAKNAVLRRPDFSGILTRLPSFGGILCKERHKEGANLWIGGAETITPLHYDRKPNLLFQVCGRKEVTLISPRYSPFLYVYPRYPLHSRIDCAAPDYALFPAFRHVRTAMVTLQAGDVLFIPVGWWHYVRSLDPSVNLSFTNFRNGLNE